MDKKTKNKLIEHINQNTLDQADKDILIDLLNKNKTEAFVKHFITACKVGIDIIRIFGMDDEFPL